MRLHWRQPVPDSTGSTDAECPGEAFAEVLLDEGREELARADGKASILLSAAGIVVAALLAGVLAGTWTPNKLHRYPATEVAFWVGLGVAVLGLVLLGLAVLPQTRHTGSKETLAYFGHVVRFSERGHAIRGTARRARDAESKKLLKEAIRAASAGRFERTVDQVLIVSRIVHRKYRLIRWALLIFAVSIAVCVGAVIANANL